MTTVVDASVALKWVCHEEGSDRAAALLDGRPLVAPSLWLTEAANALWRRLQRRELSRPEVEERLGALADAPVRTVDDKALVLAAGRFAADLGHPVYDCLYLATALAHSARVVTADRRFYAVVRGHPHFAAMVCLL